MQTKANTQASSRSHEPQSSVSPSDTLGHGQAHTLSESDTFRSGGACPARLVSSSNERFCRLAAVVVGTVAFLGIASLVKPDPRSASANAPASSTTPATTLHNLSGNTPAQGSRLDGARSSDVSQRLASTPHAKGWKLLGELESVEYRVLMHASPDGARYSVYTLDGRLLQSDLEGDDVYRVFPALDLKPLQDAPAKNDGPLMLVTPRE